MGWYAPLVLRVPEDVSGGEESLLNHLPEENDSLGGGLHRVELPGAREPHIDEVTELEVLEGGRVVLVVLSTEDVGINLDGD